MHCIHPVWGFLHFLDLSDCFLYHVKEVVRYNFFKCFIKDFLFLFSFWKPYTVNVGTFNVVSETPHFF